MKVDLIDLKYRYFDEHQQILKRIDRVLKNPKDEGNLKEVKFEVENICQSYPLYSGIEK